MQTPFVDVEWLDLETLLVARFLASTPLLSLFSVVAESGAVAP
jgi:hypothetical protein